MPSASTMQASLPDCTIMPWMRSFTVTVWPSGTNIFDPPIRHAFSLTGSPWSSVNRPALSMPKTIYAVISLVMEEGVICVSAALSSSTAPVV